MDYVTEKPFDARNSGIDVEKIAHGKTYRIVSLFSGCGGLDLGFVGGFSVFANENKLHFEKNPFEIIWANDFYKPACRAYEKYFDHEIFEGDITKIDKATIPVGDIVIGGFPCQDFSISGKQVYLQSVVISIFKCLKPYEFKNRLPFLRKMSRIF